MHKKLFSDHLKKIYNIIAVNKTLLRNVTQKMRIYKNLFVKKIKKQHKKSKERHHLKQKAKIYAEKNQ